VHEAASAGLTTTETLLSAIWRDVLERDGVPPNEDLLALGGDSLSALRIASRVADEWQVELQLADVLEHQSIRKMARHIEALRSARADGPDVRPID
jgi:acyl carrier protein